MQNSANSCGTNQQGSWGQNHFGQPMQQDPYAYNPQQQNHCNSNLQSVSGNPCLCTPGISQSQIIPCNGYQLSQNILDQIRTCVGNAAPIFILPNSQPVQSQQLPQVQQNPSPQMPVGIGYPQGVYPPSIGIGYPALGPGQIFSPACYPFPVNALPFSNPFGSQNRSQSEKTLPGCDCCRVNSPASGNHANSMSSCDENETHRCSPGNDDTVCTRANCPASVNLQALASQLLSLRGVIPCAATRLVMRRVPGSNVTTTVEQTMERAQMAIGSLKKEQLINEARNAQQVNGLINLHMTASPPRTIIPVLTMIQLKVNSLKALVEDLVNKSIGECQGLGTQGNYADLEPAVLGVKSDAEIRELLATLRQKECEERVNVNYAPYHSQRVVAESRLANFQNKISQVEAEMERRRAAGMPWAYSNGQFNQAFLPGGGHYRFTPQETRGTGAQGLDSPNPFMVRVQSPRRLNLKPNVGGPETTYRQSSEERVTASPEAFAVSKLDGETEGCCEGEKSRPSQGQENGEASDPGTVGFGGKKKLKIHIDERGELSVKKESLEELDVGEFVRLSSDVVIVVDKDRPKSVEEKYGERERPKNRKEKRSVKKKSADSIPSDSTYDSETSVSSRGSGAEGKRRETGGEKSGGKSVLGKVFKGKKKTTKIEHNASENPGHDEVPEFHDGVEPRAIKTEKHIDVAMLSELIYDRFIPRNEMDGLGSDSVSLLQDRRGPEDSSESSCTERIEEYLRDSQGRLDDVGENACGRTVQGETVRARISRSGLNEDKNVGEDGNCSFERPVRSVLKEAQNRTGDDRVSPRIVVGENTPRGGSYRDEKENVLENPKACSIIGKRNRDKQSLEGSVTSYVSRDQRKKHNYRFK